MQSRDHDRQQRRMADDSVTSDAGRSPLHRHNGIDIGVQLRDNAAFKARMIAQRTASGAQTRPDTLAIAAEGVQGSAQSLPHLSTIQRAFGRHDVRGVQAFVGGTAKAASEAIGAEAYATGNRVAFRDGPSLHTAAHEAAHVVQQRAGVTLAGGVGAVGDRYEQHADQVADAVVSGASAESLLDEFAGDRASAGAVQLRAEPGVRPSKGRVMRDPGRPAGLRPLGAVQLSLTDSNGSVSVSARSAADWRTFLAEQADEENGGIELAAFMARAMAQTQIAGVSLARVGRPKAFEAIELMCALLTTGNIDLPDKSHEQPDEDDRFRAPIIAHLGPLLARFTSTYTPHALAMLTKRHSELRKDKYPDQVGAFVEDAIDMKDHADDVLDAQTPDPSQRLVASALGTAIGAACAAVRNGSFLDETDDLLTNSARTVLGCLRELEADRATSHATMMQVFKYAAAIAGAATGGAGRLALKLLTPIADRFLSACLAGDGQKTRITLEADFNQAIDQLKRQGVSPGLAANLKKSFFRGITW